MVEKIDELSIFFPFWNEEKSIDKVISSALSVAPKVARQWEIIIVDDGSSDNTLSLAKKLAQRNSRIKIATHPPNRGYGAALKEGFSHARYNTIVFTDGDGQFDFSEVDKFIKKIGNFDLVIGYRKRRHDHPIRHLLMNLLKIWDLVLFGFYFRDIDCGFKMFKKNALNKIMPLRSEGAMITTEILTKAIKAKLSISEVEVSHFPRLYGDQSGGNIRVVIRAVKESLILWWDLHNGRA